jgi:hypothetical protein
MNDTAKQFPFSKKELIKPNALKSLFGKSVIKENAIIEINNLLAEYQPFQIDTQQFEEIMNRYDVNLQSDFPSEALNFYQAYLKFLYTDKRSADLFEIERRNLFSLQSFLKLSDEQISTSKQKVLYEIVNSHIQAAIEDRRLSLEEMKELDSLCANFGISVTFDEPTKLLLDKYRELWNIENGGELTLYDDVVEAEEDMLILKPGEHCYFMCRAEWYEYRKERSFNYSNIGVRLHGAGGIYYRMGKVNLSPSSNYELTKIGRGVLFVTDKRIVFNDYRRPPISKSIPLRSINNFALYKDGVIIQKENSQAAFASFPEWKVDDYIQDPTDTIDKFCAITNRMLQGGI